MVAVERLTIRVRLQHVYVLLVFVHDFKQQQKEERMFILRFTFLLDLLVQHVYLLFVTIKL
jgi:hypothetical protein